VEIRVKSRNVSARAWHQPLFQAGWRTTIFRQVCHASMSTDTSRCACTCVKALAFSSLFFRSVLSNKRA
jgi:hypothetical protein